MPIREESFRIGCGRYVQGAGYVMKLGEEVARLGTSPLVVGGETALSLTREKIVSALFPFCDKYEFITHTGTCNEEAAKRIAEYARTHGYDVIVGVGGGVLMDFAKLCSHFAKIPVVNLPTSSATCAAYTPLSVRYTPEGRTVGSLHFKREVDAVVVDTEIIAAEPTRLFLSGVFDALAKFVEIKQRFREDMDEYPMGLDYAFALAKRSFDILNAKTERCIADMARGDVTFDVENVIFTAVAVPGIISGIARGSNQTALGHKFYEATRFFFPESSAPYLHGEIVGVGLLLQNMFNGEEENNALVLSLMEKYGMPRSIRDVGAAADASTLEKYYEKLKDSSAIDDSNAEECERLHACLEKLWKI